MARARRENIPAKVKTAITFMVEQKADYQAAALHAGITTWELRRSMGLPHVMRYAREQKQAALEKFCLGNAAALTEIRDTSLNSMARVAAVKAGEQLRIGIIEEEGRAQKRAPGLSIVLIQKDGGQLVAFEPPQQQMLDVTPKPAAEPVPADGDVE